MNDFQILSFAPALPSADATAETPAAQNVPVFQDQSATGMREARNQQWESLRPVIREVYIEQGKPFPYLAKMLLEEYEFKTSKKQFSRKMEQWGFRKNVSRSERLRIMRSVDEKAVTEWRAGRIKEGKLKNWRKRYGREVEEFSSVLPEQCYHRGTSLCSSLDDFGSKPSLGANDEFDRCLLDLEAQAYQVAEPQEPILALPGREALDRYPPQCSEVSGSIVCPMDIDQDPWPFDWSTADVPGSPGLSRLFRGLQLACTHPVPPMLLDSSHPPEDSCLSSQDIAKLFSEDNRHISEDSVEVRSSEPVFSTSSTSKSIQRPAYPYRDVDKIFCGYTTDPLSEIYVFPSAPCQDFFCEPSYPGLPLFERLELRESELEASLSKLQGQFPETHPAVLAALEALSDVYYRAGWGKKAELMYRRLEGLYCRTLGADSLRTLKTRLRVIESMIRQKAKTHVKAQSLLGDLRSRVFKLVPPHHPLAINVAGAEAWLAPRRKSEERWRDILQITLTSYGPRHWFAVRAMARLGRFTGKASRETGEKLLRTAAQLSLENSAELDENKCKIMRNLGEMLQRRGAYEESRRVASHTLENFRCSLGLGNEDVFDIQCQLAWNMYKLGSLKESERLFRALAALHSKDNVRSCDMTFSLDGALSNVWQGLGNVLLQMGNVDEATNWFEKSFELKLSTYGPNNLVTRGLCDQLGLCYERQDRYDEILKLYRRMIKQVQASGDDRNGTIKTLESEILRIEEEMASSSDNETDESSRHATLEMEIIRIEEQMACGTDIEIDESSQHETESDCTVGRHAVSSEAGTVDEVGDDPKKIVVVGEEEEFAPEKDDWKVFIHEIED